MTAQATIHLFRKDLRLADNPALHAAAEAGPVIPLYVLDDSGTRQRTMGGASRWWLHGSLASLQAQLNQHGSNLVLRGGDTFDVVTRVVREVNAAAIHVTRGYDPLARDLERRLKAWCDDMGIGLRRYPGGLLGEPEAIRSKQGGPFRAFTPFYRALLKSSIHRPVSPPPRLPPPSIWPASERLEDWRLRPRRPDWASGLRALWTPGDFGARARLAEMIGGALGGYTDGRDRPDRPGTSMLSPHLHFGELSPRQCWQAIAMASEGDDRLAAGANAFLRQLAWREFSHHLLYHSPEIVDQPFQAGFSNFPWDMDSARVAINMEAWTRGRTGYPLVDAGMRQLWETGWMHNRVRMVVASFLTKHLLIHWRHGEDWFWDTLVDADLANNVAGWQWVAGSGAESAPYFRIFNPTLQGRRFDPDGAYIRRFVPELARLPTEYIHAPGEAPAGILAAADVRLGKDYPRPVVEHTAARMRALGAYRAMTDAPTGPGV